MIYAKISDGVIVEYPLSQVDITSRFANVSFPIPFSPPDGYVEVITTSPPSLGPEEYKKYVKEGSPVNIDGLYYQTWNILDRSQEEIEKITLDKCSSVKSIRNSLLASSDWTQLPDVELINKETWTNYRRDLRNITSQEGYPWDVSWPVKPG